MHWYYTQVQLFNSQDILPLVLFDVSWLKIVEVEQVDL